LRVSADREAARDAGVGVGLRGVLSVRRERGVEAEIGRKPSSGALEVGHDEQLLAGLSEYQLVGSTMRARPSPERPTLMAPSK